jgi:hypothetical protein
MGFIKGHGKFQKGEGGRPRGSKNKRTKEFVEVLERKNFCLASALIECYKDARAEYKYYSELFRNNRISPMEDNSHKHLKNAADILEKIGGYSYPKLKSIERLKRIDEDRPLKDISDEELDSL